MIKLNEIDMSIRLNNCLVNGFNNKIEYLEDLTIYSKKQLLSKKNLGKKSFEELERIFCYYNISYNPISKQNTNEKQIKLPLYFKSIPHKYYRKNKERDEEIFIQYVKGQTAHEIAKQFKISSCRIYQVICVIYRDIRNKLIKLDKISEIPNGRRKGWLSAFYQAFYN